MSSLAGAEGVKPVEAAGKAGLEQAVTKWLQKVFETFLTEEGQRRVSFGKDNLEIHKGWIRGGRQISLAVPVHLTPVQIGPGAELGQYQWGGKGLK